MEDRWLAVVEWLSAAALLGVVVGYFLLVLLS
jgi:hypothetical protein